MSAVTPPPAPRSAGQLARTVRRHATAHGLAEKRVRDWISYMAIGGALEAGTTGGTSPFAFRGGIALELRRQGSARATRDLDLTYAGTETDLVVLLEEALSGGYDRFSFQRTGKPLAMDRINTVRIEVAVRFDGDSWTTVAVDISPKESHRFEVEPVTALDLQSMFQIVGPSVLPCLSLRYHLAHKFHGATAERSDGLPNERVQDAIDILLIRPMISDLEAVREACIDVFESRNLHSWPPTFDPPAVWAAEFSRLASEVGLEMKELERGILLIRQFIQEIEERNPK